MTFYAAGGAVPGEWGLGVSPAAGPAGGAVLAARCPLRSALDLGALPGAVPCARLHARQVVWEWGLGRLAATVELVVSELVTNGVRASAGLAGGGWAAGVPLVRLWLGGDGGRVLVQVWDAGGGVPAWQHPGLDAEGGRGLLLVGELSLGWGRYVPAGGAGKVVWALVGDQVR
jgi:anti-sigma regulatory factor (Ser/Thr protein kinase)